MADGGSFWKWDGFNTLYIQPGQIGISESKIKEN